MLCFFPAPSDVVRACRLLRGGCGPMSLTAEARRQRLFATYHGPMRVRLSGSRQFRGVGEDRWEAQLSEDGQVATVRAYFWQPSEGGTDPQAWIEQVASRDLPPAAELYGVTFSDMKSSLGWPVTLIEGSVRWVDRSQREQRGVRLVYCLQFFDAWAAIVVTAPVHHLPAGDRTEILRVLGSAQPEQGGNEVVALADVFRVAGVSPAPRVL